MPAARVLLWSPNYAPEPTGIPPLVTDAAEGLVRAGHSVTVVTAMPNYPHRRIHPAYAGTLWSNECRNGVQVRRSWLRARPETSVVDKALYEVSIASFALPNVLREIRHADVVVCVVPTVLSAVLAAVLARLWRKPLVLWVQDIVSVAGAAVVGHRGSKLMAVVERLEAFASRRATRIVVCSPGFIEHFVALGASRERVTVLLNWVDTDRVAHRAPADNRTLRVLYAGNVGFTQGLETVVDAAGLLGEGVEFEIVGTGNALDRVRRRAAGALNVAVRDPVPDGDYPDLLASADVHLVVQRAIGAGGNLPSKIATALASGRPVVASIPEGTPAAQLLASSGGAVIVEPESPDALAKAIAELRQDPERRRRMGEAGRSFAVSSLARDVALARFESLILEQP